MVERRLEEVRRRLTALRLDALLVSHSPHVRYLSGFSGSNGLCLLTLQDQYLITDRRYRDQVMSEVQGFRIVVAKADLVEEAGRRRLLKGGLRIGFEGEHTSVDTHSNLKKAFVGSALHSTRSIVEAMCSVKDETEIRHIVAAIRITEKVYRKLLDLIKPDVTELEIAAEIGYWHKRFGADGDAFEPIVASGIRGALPHGRPTEKKIRRGEMVTLDLGCRSHGYNCDLTRTVSLGRPTSEARRIYRIVLDAQQRAIEKARPGVKASAVDRTARSYIGRHGYGRFFSHSLGHGLGIEVHEQLRLSARSKDRLCAGNVVTIEPGIYVPGFGGVRIEDDIVLRNGECDVLTRAPKELIVL